MTDRVELDPVTANDGTFRHLIEQSAQGILIECGSRSVYANDACARLLGFPDASALLRRPATLDLFADAPQVGRTAKLLAAPIGLGGPARLTVQVSRQNGSPIWLECLIQRVLWQDSPAIEYVLWDVTERRKSQERARQLQTQLMDNARMNAMREVANGIAHGLNQPRGAMLNYLNAARRMMRRGAPSDQISDVLERLMTEAERAYQVIAELESLFNHDLENAAPHDLRALLLEVVEATTVEALERDVALHTDIASDLPLAAIIRTQIQHVVFTLLRDAINAFNVEQVREVAVRVSSASRGYIQIEIADTASLNRCPERPAGNSYQPPLAMVQSLVEGNGGRIETFSGMPEGTIVIIHLPTAQGYDVND